MSNDEHTRLMKIELTKSKIYQKLKGFSSKLSPLKVTFIVLIFILFLLPSAFAVLHYRNLKFESQTNDYTTSVVEYTKIDGSETDSTSEQQKTDEKVIEDKEESKAEDLDKPAPDTVAKANPKPSEAVPTQPENDPTLAKPDSEPESEPEPEPPAPESPSAVVAFYSDNQSDTDQEDVNHQKAVNYILSSGANPIFHAGDLMEDGTQDSLNRFNTVTTTLKSSRIFYAALGNNDRKVGDSSTPSQLFLDNFAFPNNERWYSVNYGNLHMIVLDSAFAWGNSTQLSWLISDLQSSNSQNRITGVMFHHPGFASTIASYLISYGADFVVSGHNHAYNHSTSSGINYFVLSGQQALGYMVFRVYSDSVSFTAYNSGNGVVESSTFSER